MKLIIHKSKYRIRLVVFSFSLFIMLMLFQTSYLRLGTITALAAIVLTVTTLFLQGKGLRNRLSLSKSSLFLLAFGIYSVFLTVFQNLPVTELLPFLAQMIMCLLLFSVKLNPREHRYLKRVFIASAAVYSLLIIQSSVVNYREGYYHTDVQLFNTKIDPNYIGIPLVAATSFLMNNILNNRKKITSAVIYLIIVATIVYTASKGSFVALICSNSLLWALFLLNRNVTLGRKVLWILIPVLAVLILAQIFSNLFPTEWNRVASFDFGDGNGRLALWQTSLEDWWNAPIWGNGLGYAHDTHQRATHNTYLQVLSETGLVGFLLMTGFVINMLLRAVKTDTTLFCALIGSLVQIMFLDALDNRCVWILFSWIAMMPNRKKNASYYQNTSGPALQPIDKHRADSTVSK